MTIKQTFVTRSLYILWISVVACGWMNAQAQAQLPQTRLYAISPSGGQAGDVVELNLTSGEDLEEITQLRFTHPGISAAPKMVLVEGVETPAANSFLVTIEKDVPPGVYEVACGGLWGFSNPRRFVVGTRPEVIEAANNRTPETAASLTIGEVVNGSMKTSTDVDWFRFSAQPGQRIVFDCWAERIDSRMNAVLAVYDATGRRRLATSRNVKGDDPVLVFDVPTAGPYLLKLHDLTYRSGNEMTYRLEAHTAPYVEFAYPPVATAGSTSPFTLYGYNLPNGRRTGQILRGVELEAIDVEITAPHECDSLQVEQRVAPAGLGTDAFSYRFQAGTQTTNPIRIGLTSEPVLREHEPNDAAQQAHTTDLPVTIAGQFAKPGDQDVSRFTGQAGQSVTVEVIAERMGSPVDPVLVLERVVTRPDQSDEMIAVSVQDDNAASLNQNVFETRTGDPVLTFKLPETGLYQITLRDRYWETRGDASLLYRLSVRPSRPDFRVVAVPGPPTSGQVTPATLRCNDRFPVTVYAFRQDGYDGEIRIVPESLPPGVLCDGALIRSGASYATLILTAVEETSPTWQAATFTAEGKSTDSDGHQSLLAHPVRSAAVVWGFHGVFPAVCRLTQQFPVSLQAEPAPYQLATTATTIEVFQGSTVEFPVTAARSDAAHEAIRLNLQELPAQVTVDSSTTTIAKDADQQLLRLTVGDAVPAGTYPVWIQSESEVSYRRNPQAAERQKTALAAATQSANAARDTAQNATKAKSEAIRLLGLANKKVQQAQATAVATQQVADAARTLLDKFTIAQRESADVLTVAEQELSAENQRLAQAQARQRVHEETVATADADNRQAARVLSEARAMVTSLQTPEAPAESSEPKTELPGTESTVETPLAAAQRALQLAETQAATASAARETAVLKQKTDKVEFDAVAALHAASMKRHNEAFQASESARQSLVTQKQTLAQAELAARAAQQALMAAQSDAAAAERERSLAEAAEAAAATTASNLEGVRRHLEMKANEAAHAAEPRAVTASIPSSTVLIKILPAPLKLAAEPLNQGTIGIDGTLGIKVNVQRQNEFDGPVEVTVLETAGESNALQSESLQLTATQQTGVLRLTSANGFRPGNSYQLMIKAAAHSSGRKCVVDVPLCVTIPGQSGL
ncbi:coiled-coil domain-containing protein [Planctomicrobium piriforme]|uniref:hypothetical protein n=1 Tax=Planctomicrobium piriforme TaxID=1576369 RepID=UPI00111413E8|nr:hypothetical protein [Planctomicrobium piriforme]